MSNHKKILCILIICILFIMLIAIFLLCNKNTKQQNTLSATATQTETTIKSNIQDMYSKDIDESKIYSIATVQSVCNFDLSDIRELYNQSDLVLSGTIIEKKGGKMIEGLGYPGIEGTLQVEKTIKGNYDANTISFYTNGGYCTIKNYIDKISKVSKEKIEKMGLSKLSDEDINNNYMIFNNKYGTNFEINQHIVIMLEKINDKYICLSNYGFIKIKDDTQINSLDDIINLSK